MARVAFVMDKLLRKIGLSGRSFVPMLIGFGCSVPAIMATRTLSSERDRKMTILLTPFMSCSAKLPIYGLLTSAFFPKQWRGVVMISLYFAGILCGILYALILKKTNIKVSGTICHGAPKLSSSLCKKRGTADLGESKGFHSESIYHYFCGNADRMVPAEL